eukprot:TRINITY_DN23103_c0_g2_i2.p1 TRINITY_DN23103_c0_g2~~TRINITY_DN23103_c0_g2_i2.p1  ORF type:complete len:187 (-),score=-9.40 TRINITY_DN23103_c0_g2_i2:165-662(-)
MRSPTYFKIFQRFMMSLDVPSHTSHKLFVLPFLYMVGYLPVTNTKLQLQIQAGLQSTDSKCTITVIQQIHYKTYYIHHYHEKRLSLQKLSGVISQNILTNYNLDSYYCPPDNAFQASHFALPSKSKPPFSAHIGRSVSLLPSHAYFSYPYSVQQSSGFTDAPPGF